MSTKDSTLTQEYIQSVFLYNKGNLYWKIDKKSNKVKDKIAGSLHHTGYINVGLDKQIYLAHRLIFLYHHGYLPKIIDHIDGNPLNNKIENLREATNYENTINSRIKKGNKSGSKGVHWHKQAKKWQVTLKINGKQKSFGLYDDLELADLVSQEARDKYHGKFARHK
jgi:hypothetical protein